MANLGTSGMRVGLGVVATLFLVACESGSSATPCVVDDDCWNTPEAQEAGRCAPKDVWCDNGECSARCAAPCKVIQEDVNPCDEPSMICSEARHGGTQLPFCTDHPLRCVTADDCPLFRPPSTPDAQWTCEDSTCRFPGYDDRG